MERETCPSCADRRVRRSASVWVHWLRLLTGSAKRHCQWCGRRWLGEKVGSEVRVAAPALVLLIGALAWRSSGAVLIVPSRSPVFEARTPDDPPRSDDRDEYRLPLAARRWPAISSYFGLRFHPILKHEAFHEGLDLPQPLGTPVYPSRDGKVTEAGWAGGYGKRVVIRHDDGSTTIYGHLSKIRVSPGQLVERDATMIGNVGSTGLSTGPHLHFEVRDRSGRAINPRKVVSFPIAAAR